MDPGVLSSSFSGTLVGNPNIEIVKLRRSHYCLCTASRKPGFTCCLAEPDEGDRRKWIRLTQLSTTLTVVSFPLAAGDAMAKVSEKRRARKPETQLMSPEEMKSWARNLPAVVDRIPYTEILDLKSQGKIKHIVKLPSFTPRRRSETVFVVLDDFRVLRTVLPSEERDLRFWESWDQMGIGSLCVNAYTPQVQVKPPPEPFLGFLRTIPAFLVSLFPSKPQSKRVLELQMARKALKERKMEELAKLREQREMMEKAIRMQKKMEERKRKKERRKIEYERSLERARANYNYMAEFWTNMATDKRVSTILGLLFFAIFYRTVVFSYRKQKKDYEDRLKIEQAEAEERKKMRALEREVEGIEAEADDDDGKAGGEQNPYLKMAMQFMKSGAKVRRARSSKVPQYMDRGVDVKFSDVAGLGKIRLELEEVVKFFTHGEVYRRRGVKIPGTAVGKWKLLVLSL